MHALESILGYTFANPALLKAALTHPSVASSAASSYERMEFLGDSVLGLVICQVLYEKYPAQTEGELTQTKSEVVSRKICAQVAKEIGLPFYMHLGRSVDVHAVPVSVAAAGIESVIGALYLDGGLEAARPFILRHFAKAIEAAAANEHRNNWKAVLQTWAQKEQLGAPQYRVLAERGPEHEKVFEVEVSVSGRIFKAAHANTKKQGEQDVARSALLELGVV